MKPFRDRAAAMKAAHQAERHTLKTAQAERQQREELTRGNRLRKGVMGLWDRLSGRRGKVSEVNAKEATAGRVRDRDERQSLIDRQKGERRELQAGIVQMRGQHQAQRQEQRAELATMLQTVNEQGHEAGQDIERGQEQDRAEPSRESGRGGRSRNGEDGPRLRR